MTSRAVSAKISIREKGKRKSTVCRFVDDVPMQRLFQTAFLLRGSLCGYEIHPPVKQKNQQEEGRNENTEFIVLTKEFHVSLQTLSLIRVLHEIAAVIVDIVGQVLSAAFGGGQSGVHHIPGGAVKCYKYKSYWRAL